MLTQENTDFYTFLETMLTRDSEFQFPFAQHGLSC